ncbi:hypothetical protein CUMW_149590 [Citrus unshiu]|nr:hypothetical protein CUMW_149590 [Citrus unshiu]
MATQIATLSSRLIQHRKTKGSKKIWPTTSHQHSERWTHHNSDQINDAHVKGKKMKMKMKRKPKHWAQERSRLRFWYVTTSIRYLLRKARAFYNEFCSEKYDDNPKVFKQVMIADPYFSIPVIPPPM